MQISTFVRVLDEMTAKAKRKAHAVRGPLAIAGSLTRKEIFGEFELGSGSYTNEDGETAEVSCSDSATIQSGAWVVRTVVGTKSHGRQKTDHYAYVPFRSARSMNHCVMRIDQILLVRRKNMGWRNNEARLAVGMLWDHLAVRSGTGLETSYNDDPTKGACCVPRALFLNERMKGKGTKTAIFLRQIHCPCVFVPGPPGHTFIRLSKMKFHGRRDLMMCGSDAYEGDSDDE